MDAKSDASATKRRRHQMQCAYKRELYKQQKEEYQAQEKRASISTYAMMITTIHGMFRFSANKLQDIIKQMWETFGEAFIRYKDDDSEVFDHTTVPIILKGLENTLSSTGVDLKGIEAEYDPLRKVRLRKYVPPKMQLRFDYVKGKELVARNYAYAIMAVLNDSYGFGQKRLTALYTAFRKRYMLTWELYLQCTIPGDESCKEMIESYIAEAKKYVPDIDNMDDMTVEVHIPDNKE